MVKGTLHWYRRKWRSHCLTRLTGCTHQATLIPLRNISPHPRSPVMFQQFTTYLSIPQIKNAKVHAKVLNFPLCASSNRCLWLSVGGIRCKVLSLVKKLTDGSETLSSLLLLSCPEHRTTLPIWPSSCPDSGSHPWFSNIKLNLLAGSGETKASNANKWFSLKLVSSGSKINFCYPNELLVTWTLTSFSCLAGIFIAWIKETVFKSTLELQPPYFV